MKPADRIVMRVLSLFCLAIGAIPQKGHTAVARVVGRLWFILDNQHRSITIDNLKQAFPDQAEPAEIEALARRVFVSFSRLLLEVCWAMHKNLDSLSGHIDRSEMRFIKAALKKNKGALILTGHLGNWELLPAAASLEKISNHAVYRPLDVKPLDRFVIRMRSRFGTNMIPATQALRKIVAALKRNETVGLLIDQNSDPHNGVVVEFFGRPAFATKGLALIARQTGAPVVPAFLVREKDRFRFVSGPEIPFVRTGDARKDIEVNTQRYNLAIEKAVRQYPEQWFWVHRRWKTRPSSPWPRQSG